VEIGVETDAEEDGTVEIDAEEKVGRISGFTTSIERG
jgi:hypothetical protein